MEEQMDAASHNRVRSHFYVAGRELSESSSLGS